MRIARPWRGWRRRECVRRGHVGRDRGCHQWDLIGLVIRFALPVNTPTYDLRSRDHSIDTYSLTPPPSPRRHLQRHLRCRRCITTVSNPPFPAPSNRVSSTSRAMSRSLQDQFIYDDDEEETCPLCVEEFDLTDQGFRPCPCGYQVCSEPFSARKHLLVFRLLLILASFRSASSAITMSKLT